MAPVRMENHPTPCHRDVLILFAIVLTCCAKKVRTYNVCSRISKRLQQQKQKLQVKTVINFGPRTFCVDSSMVEPWQRHSQGLWFCQFRGVLRLLVCQWLCFIAKKVPEKIFSLLPLLFNFQKQARLCLELQ